MGVFPEPTVIILTAAALLAVSGVPGLLPVRPEPAQRCGAALAAVASLLGAAAAAALLLGGVPAAVWQLAWPLPSGPATLAADHLSALFLLPLFIITGCASVYAPAYWPAGTRPGAAQLSLFLGLFTGAMVLVLLARHGMLFLVAWETMALSAYFLLSVERQDLQVQRVGTVYLLATHTGTMALFALFGLLCAGTGSFLFPAARSLPASAPFAAAILACALFGFGGKAGLMPLHFWLPGAHANAPSHVSALMSGVMLKMGIYGILRTLSFYTAVPAWTVWALLLLGGVSTLGGIAQASAQRDLKRLLACSSIENVGIIVLGIGLGLAGLHWQSPVLAACGFAGAFIHIINHGMFKALLFLGSGAVIHAAGTREIDRLGGLARRMPATGLLFLTGALAICGLPPLNGFVGELFLYLGAFRDSIAAPIPLAALAVPVLALAGGLALITFVKLYGIAFLGEPRSPGAAAAHEAARPMTAAMALLAVGCLAGGLAPPLLLRLAAPAVTAFSGLPHETVAGLAAQVPLQPLMVANGLLALLLLGLALAYRARLRRLPRESAPTWGCGYARPTARMQYTGSSFSELVVNQLGSVAAPLRQRPVLTGAAFPGRAGFAYQVTETVLDRVLTPLLRRAGRGCAWMRRLQHGRLHIYVLYIAATLFALMFWVH